LRGVTHDENPPLTFLFFFYFGIFAGLEDCSKMQQRNCNIARDGVSSGPYDTLGKQREKAKSRAVSPENPKWIVGKECANPTTPTLNDNRPTPPSSPLLSPGDPGYMDLTPAMWNME
jgi:hypothetical protein